MNDASLKLVVIYSCCTFNLKPTFYSLWHSATIFERCEKYVNRKQCIDFLLHAILLYSRTASLAMCFFFSMFSCVPLSDVVLFYECRYVKQESTPVCLFFNYENTNFLSSWDIFDALQTQRQTCHWFIGTYRCQFPFDMTTEHKQRRYIFLCSTSCYT